MIPQCNLSFILHSIVSVVDWPAKQQSGSASLYRTGRKWFPHPITCGLPPTDWDRCLWSLLRTGTAACGPSRQQGPLPVVALATGTSACGTSCDQGHTAGGYGGRVHRKSRVVIDPFPWFKVSPNRLSETRCRGIFSCYGQESMSYNMEIDIRTFNVA